ncbi:IclR family transcriptional regulator domain-containing protein [Sediminivirga luteola]|uniref:IclR family transcriptional regulator domain-containing protein n=1 Tax=Sediminivirga luteola TaxID=1774748 RepID=UPI001F5A5B4D|nr:IclR family transcriptional regulator C-terminal domain-containing protein [Sediminivirga luteola]MCI2264422.1 hypothetical protein [Sediminivirga luteola]
MAQHAPDLVTLKALESTRSVKASYGWGSLSGALHATAPGKAIAAWLPEESLTHLTGTGELQKYTDATIATVPDLLKHLRLVQRHRIAHREEFTQGLTSLSATVRDSDGAVIGAYTCCLPTLRADQETVRNITQSLIAGAQEIATALGH